MGGLIFVIVVIALILWVLASCIRIVPQAYAIVVERLGAYKETWNTGIHFKTPFIDRVARRVNLKEQVVECYHADRHSCIFSDYRSKAFYLWRGKSDHGDRKSFCDHTP